MRISLDEPEKPIEKTADSAEREAIKKTWQGEKKKLSEMKGSDKVKYIWSYYRVQIILFIVAVLGLSYLTYSLITRKDATIMGIVINDSSINSEAYCNKLGEYLGLDNKHKTELLTDINLLYNSGSGNANGMNNGNYAGTTQILCYVTAGELDYTFTDINGLKYMDQQELALKLDEFLPDYIYAAFKDRMYTVKDGSLEGPRAIDMTGTRLAKCLDLKASPVYLCFQNRSNHKAEMDAFLKFLYEFEFGDGSLTF